MINPKNKTYYINGYSLSITETSKYYWSERQHSLLKYLYDIKSSLMNKNILVLFDPTGFCSIFISLFGGRVTIFSNEEHSFFVKKNIEMNLEENRPKIIYENDPKEQYDMIIISDAIYSNNEVFNKIFYLINQYSNPETKIILTIRKLFWENEMFLQESHTHPFDILSHFPKNYSRKQMTPFSSKENIVFELQKEKVLWIEEKNHPNYLL